MSTAAALPRPDRARDFEFDGVVRLTRIGVTYVIFTVALGFAALNTGNNALYIGLTAMLGCLLLSGIASKSGLRGLSVELVTTDDIWAGRQVHGLLRVTNRSRIWNVRDVLITSDQLAEPVLLAIVPRKSEITTDAPFLFRRRGIVSLSKLNLYTRYPFGFFLKKRRVPIEGELVVFPRIRDGDAARERFRPSSGEQSTANRPGPGTEIHSFREYVRGDSMRHVYWKKSASLGRWIMKQTDAESARVVHVAIDAFKPRTVTDDDFEEMVTDATTFIHHALRRGLDVVVSLPRVTLRAREWESAHSIFRALALLEPIHEPLDMTIDRDTIVFSARSSYAESA